MILLFINDIRNKLLHCLDSYFEDEQSCKRCSGTGKVESDVPCAHCRSGDYKIYKAQKKGNTAKTRK